MRRCWIQYIKRKKQNIPPFNFKDTAATEQVILYTALKASNTVRPDITVTNAQQNNNSCRESGRCNHFNRATTLQTRSRYSNDTERQKTQQQPQNPATKRSNWKAKLSINKGTAMASAIPLSHTNLVFFLQSAIFSIRGGKSCCFVATLICFVALDDLFHLYDVSLTH
jgi:hypothetical protein